MHLKAEGRKGKLLGKEREKREGKRELRGEEEKAGGRQEAPAQVS